MLLKDKQPRFMTSAELEDAIRKHRAQTKKLLAEVRKRRTAEAETDTKTKASYDLKK